MFSADVGPHTEYHYLPEAAPRHGWAVACFASREAGRAWHVIEDGGHKEMCQVLDERRPHTHPMLSSGDDAWADYALRVRFRPESESGMSGVVFRYHNNRCHYFFGFDDNRLVLRLVLHEAAYRVPGGRELASVEATRDRRAEWTASVVLHGTHIRAEIEGLARLEATDETFLHGKIGLLADTPTRYRSVEVSATAEEASRIVTAQSREVLKVEKLRSHYPRPVLLSRFDTPGFGAARNLRFGDLTGDGRPDLVIGQITHHGPRDAYSEVGCITAMTFDGKVLWQSGTPDPAKYSLTNDVALQIHDIDGDDRNEVVFCRDFELFVADGATGEVKYYAPTLWRCRPRTGTRASWAIASSSAMYAARGGLPTLLSRTATGTSGCWMIA